MKKYKLPKKLISQDHNLRDNQWILVDEKKPYYWFKNHDIDTLIIAYVIRQNNRGITLYTYAVTGERLEFTLKPSQWNFIYGED